MHRGLERPHWRDGGNETIAAIIIGAEKSHFAIGAGNLDGADRPAVSPAVRAFGRNMAHNETVFDGITTVSP